MKPRQAVWRETRRVALGTVILTAAMLGAFALLGRFDLRALLGGLYGCALAVANFFFLGLTVQRIAETKDVSDPEQVARAKLRMRNSYTLRMVAGAVLLALAIAALKLNWIACMLPLVFPQAVILGGNLVERRRRARSGGNDIKE